MSVLALRKAKAPALLSPERQALAEAIQAVADTQEAIRKAEEARTEATDKLYAAEEVIDRAEEERERTNERAAGFIRAKIAGKAVAPPGLRRRGPSLDERLAKAKRESEVWRAVRDAAPTVIEEQRQALKWAQAKVEDCVTAVIAAEATAAVEPLLARLEALNAEMGPIRAALHEILWKGRLSGEPDQRVKAVMGTFGRGFPWALADYTPQGFENQPAKRLMDASFAQLKQDAMARLPTVEQIRSAGNAS